MIKIPVKKLLLLYKTLMEISLSKKELTEFQKDWYPYQMLLNDIGKIET